MLHASRVMEKSSEREGSPLPIQSLCTVQSMEQLNPYAFSILLQADSVADFAQPGQFVHIKCGHSRLLRRPISICDVEGGQLRLVFEVRGEGTQWLSKRKAGDQLDIIGPLGNGFKRSGDKLLLVGGGIGLPPMLYCAKAWDAEAHVIAGFRSKDRAMLLGELEEAARTLAVASDDGTVGVHGFVDELVKAALHRENGIASVLACGPKPMLRAVVQAANVYGVPCQVSMEERMACGVGACLGCALPMADGSIRHVCKDGPVFQSGEVDWNA